MFLLVNTCFNFVLKNPRYLNAIETMCPHILRYLTTAVIINKQNRRTMLKDLVKVIQQVSDKIVFYIYNIPEHTLTISL